MSQLVLNTCTLSDEDGHKYNVYDPPKGGRPTNVFTMHTGASRPGIGRYLMTKSDFEQLDETGTLTINGPPGPGVSIPVVVMAAVPYATGPSADSSALGTNMMEVIVADMREQLTTPMISCAFNVQQQGFPYTTPDTPIFYTQTINGSIAWSWNDVLDNLTNSPAFPQNIIFPNPDPSSWQPRNLIYDGCSCAKIIDDIGEQVYVVTGFDYTQDNFLDGIQYYPPGNSQDGNTDDSGNTNILNNAKNYVIAGSDPNNPTNSNENVIGTDSWLRFKTRFPAIVRVEFKIYDATNPFPIPTSLPQPPPVWTAGTPSFQRTYSKDIINNSGSANDNYVLPLNYGNYIAIISGNTIYNQAELDTVALDIGNRFLSNLQLPLAEKVFAGIWPLIPDGLVRGIQWVSNRMGATTRVRFNNEKDFDPVHENKRVVDAISNQLIVGLGVTNSSVGPSGSRQIWTPTTHVLVKFNTNTSLTSLYTGYFMFGSGSASGIPPIGFSQGPECYICNLNEIILNNEWPTNAGEFGWGDIVNPAYIGPNGTMPLVYVDHPGAGPCD